jgi:hypothetical protein
MRRALTAPLCLPMAETPRVIPRSFPSFNRSFPLVPARSRSFPIVPNRPSHDRQRSELRRSPGSCVDGDRAIETVINRRSVDRPPQGVTQARQVREAHNEIDRELGLGAGRERQAERQIDGGRARVLKKQRAAQRAQRETEGVRVGHLHPESHRRAADGRAYARADEPDLCPAVWRLVELRRLNEIAQRTERGAPAQ